MLDITIGSNPSELCPEGTFVGRCVRVVFMGTQPTNFGDKRLISLGFELLDEDARRSDGEPFVLSRRFTFSTYETAAFRRLLDTWLGKQADGTPFDLRSLGGTYGQITVVHGANGDRQFANISTVIPLAKGMTKPEGVNDVLVFDAEAPDEAVLALLPAKMQEQIRESVEYKDAKLMEV